MTYQAAASKADEAKKYADVAWRDASDSTRDGRDYEEAIGRAVAFLADAVGELARSLEKAE